MSRKSSKDTVTELPKSPSLLYRYDIPLKLHYFLFFAGSGVLYPILGITLGTRGLSSTEISFLSLIIPFMVFVTNPIFGLLADRSRRFVLTFNATLSLATIFYLMLFLLPSIKSSYIQADMRQSETRIGRVLDFCTSEYVATTCASKVECGCIYRAECTSLTTITILNESKRLNLLDFNFTMNSKQLRTDGLNVSNLRQEKRKCGIHYRVPIENALLRRLGNDTDPFQVIGSSTPSPNAHLASCEIKCSIPHYCYGPRFPQQMRIILLYAIVFVLSGNFLTNCITIGTSIGFAALRSPDQFGRQRVWGTIGSGLAGFIASRLYGYFQTEYIYIWMYIILIILCMFVTTTVRILPRRRSTITIVNLNGSMEDGMNKKKKKQKSPDAFNLAVLLPLLKRLDVIIFLSMALLWGMSFGALDPYIFLYVDEIASCEARSILGWMSLISATAEVTAFFVADKLLKFLGTNTASIVIFLAFFLRFSGYYSIRQPYLILPCEVLHFFNFGVLYVLVAKRADSMAPPRLAGTLQGLVYGLSFGLGRGIGLLISMFVYTGTHKRRLFLVYATINLVAGIAFGLYFIIRRLCFGPSHLPQNQTNEICYQNGIPPEDKQNGEPLLSTSDKSDKLSP